MRIRGWAFLLLGGALLCSAAGSPAEAGSKIDVNGVIDLELRYEEGTNAPEHAEFDLHHFNLIGRYQITQAWRVLGEVEYEHGPDVSDGFIDGRITLEQAWLEYRRSRRLQLRLGKILPPFGLYNEIHDRTPIHLFVRLPQAIYGAHEVYPGQVQNLYTKFLTGLQFRGNADLGTDAVGELRLYVGNGRGPESHGGDGNANKAVGGKLVFREKDQLWHVGASYYRDRNGLADDMLQQHLLFEGKWTPGFLSRTVELLSEVGYSRLDTPAGEAVTPLGAYLMIALCQDRSFMPWIRAEGYRGDSQGTEWDKGLWLGAAYDVAFQVRLKIELFYSEGGPLGVRRGVLTGVAAHF
jgi:hypothetical protein